MERVSNEGGLTPPATTRTNCLANRVEYTTSTTRPKGELALPVAVVAGNGAPKIVRPMNDW